MKICQMLKSRRNRISRVCESMNKIDGILFLKWSNKSDSRSLISSSTSATNAMNIVFFVIWDVVVDHQGQILNIKPASNNGSRNQNLAFSSFKIMDGGVSIGLI